jgi:predicted DCC family thiol-disulfide oxidoreductase YuxK
VRLLKRLDRDHRVTVVPYQRTGVPASAGLTVEECEAAAWAVSPDGRRYRGAGAANASLAVALGTCLPLFLYDLPGVKQLQDAVYDWIANNRGWLSGDALAQKRTELPQPSLQIMIHVDWVESDVGTEAGLDKGPPAMPSAGLGRSRARCASWRQCWVWSPTSY